MIRHVFMRLILAHPRPVTTLATSTQAYILTIMLSNMSTPISRIQGGASSHNTILAGIRKVWHQPSPYAPFSRSVPLTLVYEHVPPCRKIKLFSGTVVTLKASHALEAGSQHFHPSPVMPYSPSHSSLLPLSFLWTSELIIISGKHQQALVSGKSRSQSKTPRSPICRSFGMVKDSTMHMVPCLSRTRAHTTTSIRMLV